MCRWWCRESSWWWRMPHGWPTSSVLSKPLFWAGPSAPFLKVFYFRLIRIDAESVLFGSACSSWKIRKVFWWILLIRKCWLYLCIRQRGRGENTWSNFKRLCTVATWWGVCRSWCRWRRWWRGGRGRSRSCKPCGRCHSSGKGCNSDLNLNF